MFAMNRTEQFLVLVTENVFSFLLPMTTSTFDFRLACIDYNNLHEHLPKTGSKNLVRTSLLS